jgi:hypothetical protein
LKLLSMLHLTPPSVINSAFLLGMTSAWSGNFEAIGKDELHELLNAPARTCSATQSASLMALGQ